MPCHSPHVHWTFHSPAGFYSRHCAVFWVPWPCRHGHAPVLRLLYTFTVLLPLVARADEAALTRDLQSHTGSVMSLAFSPDGATLASSSRDKTVKLWNAREGKLITTLDAHTDDVYCVSFTTKGGLLATCSADKTIRIWDIRTLKP